MLAKMKIGSIKHKVLPFPHHTYMLHMTSRFFSDPSFFNIITMDRMKTVDQMVTGKLKDCGFVPRCLLLDPTSACNLSCTGCWAAGYHRNDSLSYEKLDDILTQAEELHIRYCFLSGGEPLVRKEELLALCKKHRKISFSAFTNGTLIDDDFARKAAQVGNLTFSLSVEGFEEDTDFRRGKGVYRKVMAAAELLRKHHIAFAFSACYHSKNFKAVASDEFLDAMFQMGCWMGWLFTYIPVGNEADMDLVCTAQQRGYLQKKIKEYNRKNNVPVIDFWNSGHVAAGCVAAGTGFVHINARGDIEPCAFAHYSDSNIHEVTLKEALMRPFFARFRAAQPFSENPLRPCPLIDVPEAIEEAVISSGAHSTELSSPENVRDFTNKVRSFARIWEKEADAIYREFPQKEKRAMSRNISFLKWYRKKQQKNFEKSLINTTKS